MDLAKLRELAGILESDEAKVDKIIREIGAKHGVDFNDADGKAAHSAMVACYKKGVQDGFNMG